MQRDAKAWVLVQTNLWKCEKSSGNEVWGEGRAECKGGKTPAAGVRFIIYGLRGLQTSCIRSEECIAIYSFILRCLFR